MWKRHCAAGVHGDRVAQLGLSDWVPRLVSLARLLLLKIDQRNPRLTHSSQTVASRRTKVRFSRNLSKRVHEQQIACSSDIFMCHKSQTHLFLKESFVTKREKSMLCPHCLHTSLSRICSYCGGEHEPMSSQIRRRQGWKKLLVRPSIMAVVMAFVFLLLGIGWPGLMVGVVFGAILGAMFQLLIRVKRFR